MAAAFLGLSSVGEMSPLHSVLVPCDQDGSSNTVRSSPWSTGRESFFPRKVTVTSRRSKGLYKKGGTILEKFIGCEGI